MSKAPRAFRLDGQPSAPETPVAEPSGFTLQETDDEAAFLREEDRVVAREEHQAELGLGRRLFGWGGVLAGALGGLLLLWLGASLEGFIADLLARNPVAGAVALALTALAAVAVLVLAGREIAGILRARSIARLKERAEGVLASDDGRAGRAVLADLQSLYSGRPDTARARARLAETSGDVIDGADLIRLAERELMVTLDREARAAVTAAARRVSVVTAISPRAVVDLVFVAAQALRLVRRISEIYGGRPGALGFLRLLRAVGAHLAVTGGMAVGEGLVQQVLGHGIAARLSARLGEGVLNGLLTARVGLSAIAVCRPLPFAAEPPPTITDVAAILFSTEGPAKPAR
jgi:putative membrane protein